MFTEENNIVSIQENNKFYVLFVDTNNCLQKVEVSEIVYNEFVKFKRTARNLQRSNERHIEYVKLTDIELFTRSFIKPKSIEDIITENERAENLYKAIEELPKKQRRRFILYFVHGLTYKQIAEIENTSFQSIATSIKLAKINILKYF